MHYSTLKLRFESFFMNKIPMITRVLITPSSPGLQFPSHYVHKIYGCHPELFDEPISVDALCFGRRNGKTDAEIENAYVNCCIKGDYAYFLSEEDDFRAHPWLLAEYDQQEKDPVLSEIFKNVKCIELPADISGWYIDRKEDLSEEIHERHQVWV